jgi:SAM-dependent methyltransferase
MEEPSYAYGVFTRHFSKVQFPRRSTGWIGLELGPGDSLFSALIARSFLASACYLTDAGDFAEKDLQKYRDMAVFLQQKGLPAPQADHLTSIEDVLKTCNSTYGTAGIASLRVIPRASVDFIWSQAVLQSVRRAEFVDYIRELRRVLRDDGICSHLVPLNDLSVGALNHLRFGESVWESDMIARCGFYTNRFRYSEMVAMFQEAGFHVDNVRVNRWNQLPTPRSKLARQFRSLPDEELRVSSFEIVLRPA